MLCWHTAGLMVGDMCWTKNKSCNWFVKENNRNGPSLTDKEYYSLIEALPQSVPIKLQKYPKYGVVHETSNDMQRSDKAREARNFFNLNKHNQFFFKSVSAVIASNFISTEFLVT